MTLRRLFSTAGCRLILAATLAFGVDAAAQTSFSDSSRLSQPTYVKESIKEIDDAHLWRSIDLGRPGLEKVLKHVRARDYANAAAAWSKYWSTRQHPSYLTSMDHLLMDTDLLTPVVEYQKAMHDSAGERGLVLARANQVLANEIKAWGDNTVDFGKKVDFNKAIGQSGKYGFHYWIWSRPLIMAWAITGDQSYLAKFDQLFQWWYEQRNSVARSIPEFDVVYYELGLGVRNRAFIEYYLSPFSHRNGQSHVRMLKTLLAAGRWLYELEKWEGYRAGNWQVHGSYMLFQLGLTLPEFREAAEWRRIGLQRMLEHLERDFFSDGGHSERSPRNYTMATYLSYRNLAYLMSAYNVEESAAKKVRASMGRTLGWWKSILTPTGELPAINDSHRGLFPERVMRDGLAFFGVTAHSQPRSTSRHLPESGFTVMRSDSTQDALYLLVNYGPFAGFHSHYDLLDFELYAFGKPLAVDAGIGTTYDDPLYPDWYRSSRAHNMVAVNDSNIEREGLKGENIQWGSTSMLDFFAGTERGYRRFGIQHRRQIVFVKPSYWFLLDDMLCTRGGDTLSWYFHSPYPLVSSDQGVTSASAPGIKIAPVGIDYALRTGKGAAASSTERIPGKTDEIGWVRFDQVSSADSLIQFPMLLFPYQTSVTQARATRISTKQFVVEHENFTDHLYFAGGDYQDGTIKTDGEFLLIRKEKDHRLSYVVINGTFLQFRTKTLWSSHNVSSGEGQFP